MNYKTLIITAIGFVCPLMFLHAQPVNKNSYLVHCSTWNCLEQNKNKEAFIEGIFQKYTPNKSGKGANHMFWDWEILLSDSFSVPVGSTNPEIDYKLYEGKKVIVKGIVFYGIVIGSAKGQNATGFRIDPLEIKEAKNEVVISNPNYDKALADKLGGDDYGMKSYFLVILKTGANKTTDKELINESFRGHMDNINRLVEASKLIVAGPLSKNDNSYRGIFILSNTASPEEAKQLLQNDPAIKNGLLDYDIFTWYGSAALPEYLPASDKIWKTKP